MSLRQHFSTRNCLDQEKTHASSGLGSGCRPGRLWPSHTYALQHLLWKPHTSAVQFLALQGKICAPLLPVRAVPLSLKDWILADDSFFMHPVVHGRNVPESVCWPLGS